MESPLKRRRVTTVDDFKEDMSCIVCGEWRWEFDLGVSMHSCGSSICATCWLRMDGDNCPICREPKGQLIHKFSSTKFAPADMCLDCGSLKRSSGDHLLQCPIQSSKDIKKAIAHWPITYVTPTEKRNPSVISALEHSKYYIILIRGESQVAVVQFLSAVPLPSVNIPKLGCASITPFHIQFKLCAEPTLPDMFWFTLKPSLIPSSLAFVDKFWSEDIQFAIRFWGVVFTDNCDEAAEFLLRRPNALIAFELNSGELFIMRRGDQDRAQGMLVGIPPKGEYIRSSTTFNMSIHTADERKLKLRFLIKCYNVMTIENHLSAPPDIWADLGMAVDEGNWAYQ